MKKNKNKKSKKNTKNQNIVLVTSIIIIIICLFVSIKTIIKDKQRNQKTNDSDVVNKEILNDTKVGNLTISNAKITINDDVSSYTATVTNNTNNDEYIGILYVTFITRNNIDKIPVLKNTTLKPNAQEIITLALDSNVSNATKIEYTIE